MIDFFWTVITKPILKEFNFGSKRICYKDYQSSLVYILEENWYFFSKFYGKLGTILYLVYFSMSFEKLMFYSTTILTWKFRSWIFSLVLLMKITIHSGQTVFCLWDLGCAKLSGMQLGWSKLFQSYFAVVFSSFVEVILLIVKYSWPIVPLK